MKGTTKNLKIKDMKNENSKETDANESSTPEISARSRLSLDGTMAQREDEKEEQILQLGMVHEKKNFFVINSGKLRLCI